MTADSTTLSGSLRWWHLAFGGVPLVVLAIVASLPDRVSLLAAALALLAVTATWFAVGRLSFRSRTARRIYVPLLLVNFAVIVALEPSGALLQTVIYPYVWSLTERLRAAVALNLAVAAALVVGTLFGGADGVPGGLLVAGLSLAFSLAFGSWFSRVADWGAERGRLLDELTAAQDQLAAAHRDQGVIAERERLSRELHDTLTQSLTGLVMAAERAKRTAAERPSALPGQLETVESLARTALGEARAIVAATAPVPVEEGLKQALDTLTERFARELSIDVSTRVAASVPRDLEVVLLRCAQEGLANIRKHARARRATVTVEEESGSVVLTVDDDGVGVAVETPGPGGYGIAGMRERVALVGGSVELTGRSGGGARLAVIIPVVGQEEATA